MGQAIDLRFLLNSEIPAVLSSAGEKEETLNFVMGAENPQV